MKKINGFAIVVTITMLLAGAAPALAVPQLQLYIDGATYDTSSKTWVTDQSGFYLGAYLNPGNGTSLSDTYYLTTAFQAGMPGPFTFDGQPVSASQLYYGTPPVDQGGTFQFRDAGDLEKHGVFPAWFYQYAFTFDPNQTVPLQDFSPTGSGPSATATMYQRLFWVDTTGLEAETLLHFDVFNVAMNGNDVDVLTNAPFSHDAAAPVPEPGTLVLLGTGLVGLAGYGRRRLYGTR